MVGLKIRTCNFVNVFAATVFLLSLAQGAVAGTTAQTRIDKYIDVPVFYVTDRDKVGDTFNGRRKPEHDSIYELNCGKGRLCFGEF